ncbi:Hypothetical predicted protein [Pelobates cultripes]|uniref:Uncharacterized protein n=1 Tax=Pelobates cultripes TaxID=61616 RepID=A0AAD1S026_PELCU|nr:Hypothetical predicted protein [Pelobates cultripes]
MLRSDQELGSPAYWKRVPCAILGLEHRDIEQRTTKLTVTYLLPPLANGRVTGG